MRSVTRTPQAECDLIEIWDHIATDSEQSADGVLRRIETRINSLAEYPWSGRERPELARDLRSIPAWPYLVFYRIVGEDVQILRVVHGARDLPPLFE